MVSMDEIIDGIQSQVDITDSLIKVSIFYFLFATKMTATLDLYHTVAVCMFI